MAIGTGLVHDPAVLILDEPSAALDPVQRVDLQEVIKDLAAARLVMNSTHLIEDISVLADSVLVIREGRLAHSGPVQDLISGAAGGRGSSDLERAIFSMLKRQEVA